ncbi:hypothetical protein ACWDD9_10405 [Kitasatospora sp. NPDC001119]
MARLRLRYFSLPRPVIHLLDTPAPGCLDCKGEGYWGDDHDIDEYGDPRYVTCCCWDPDRGGHLLPVPLWIARHFLGWTPTDYSDEPLL